MPQFQKVIMIQSESDPNLQIDIYMRSETEKSVKSFSKIRIAPSVETSTILFNCDFLMRYSKLQNRKKNNCVFTRCRLPFANTFIQAKETARLLRLSDPKSRIQQYC